MLEFVVNRFITLRLEEGKTNIYINNELFRQCKFLLLEIPRIEFEYLEEIESIDDAIIKLDKSLEKKEIHISAETEFWGHCSNLQVWSEYNYNTKLIHSDLAFPLLKKLVEVGDPIAQKVFKEEIAKRLGTRNQNVIEFLIKNGYTKNLDDEELIYLILDQKEYKHLKLLEEFYKLKLNIVSSKNENGIIIKNRHIEYISLQNNNLKEVPKEIEEFTKLKYLDLSYNEIEIFPEFITRLEKLNILKLNKNKIKGINFVKKSFISALRKRCLNLFQITHIR